MAKIPKRRRGSQRMPKNLAGFDNLPRRSQIALENAAHVVTRMREGASLTSASTEYGIAPKTVLRLAGPALRKTESGHYAAKRSDSLLLSRDRALHDGAVFDRGPAIIRQLAIRSEGGEQREAVTRERKGCRGGAGDQSGSAS